MARKLGACETLLAPHLPTLLACSITHRVVLQLMIPAESAHQTVLALGDIGLLQFKDLNGDKSAAQRIYASQVRITMGATSSAPDLSWPL